MYGEEPLLTYPICADANQTQLDPLHDHAWELSLLAGEPPALDLHTTYGLRCLGMRLFPTFAQYGEELIDPRAFASFPHLEQRHPNYLRLVCRPFSSIDVELEYWVPSSSLICGRIKMTNLGSAAASLQMSWNTVLLPGYKGSAMNPVEMGVNTVMQGNCETLFPVFFITGGPEVTSKTYPSLGFTFTLPENASRRLRWGLAALDSPENSVVLARHGTSLNWENEITRTELEEKNKNLEFQSESKDWDVFLQESQIRSRQFLVNGLNRDQSLHLVSKREIDTHLQEERLLSRSGSLNGEANLYQLWLASRLFLPANPEIIKNLIRTTLDRQQANGAVPFTVSPAGAVSSVKAPPLLATLVLDIAPGLRDDPWLHQVYPQLLRSLQAWLNKDDAILPVWESPMQTGMENSSLFSSWQPDDLGLDIRTVFHPSLIALLYKEASSLLQIGRLIHNEEDINWLASICSHLQSALEPAYEARAHSYRYQDLVTRRCEKVQPLHTFKKEGSVELNQSFKNPRRVLITCSLPVAVKKSIQVILAGTSNGESREESIQLDLSGYHTGQIRATSRAHFSTIAQVTVQGLPENSVLTLKLAGTDQDDLSLFMPLWAGMLAPDRAKELIEHTLLPRYLSPFGLTCFPLDSEKGEQNNISILWNTFILEGLLHYGYREAAAMVLKNLYSTLITNWKQNDHPNSSFRAADGRGSADQDSLESLTPIWPFLKLLGVEFLDHQEVILQGFNDLFDSFTVQYERVMLSLSSHSTVIQTINGSRTEIEQEGRYKILLP